MKQHGLRPRLASAVVLAAALMVATACSPVSSGHPSYAANQHGGTFQAIAGGY